MFKFNKRVTKWTYFTPGSSVFIVGLEQVNAHRDWSKKMYILHVVVRNYVHKQENNNIYSKIFSFTF